jgi:putative Holliday junction resolvase
VRYLCIDLGDARTGLALGDLATTIVSPLAVLEIPRSQLSGQALLAAITRAVSDHKPTALLLGLPLNMDGSDGPRAKLVRQFAKDLERATNLPVTLHDERLSTAQADWDMARTGLTRGQKKLRRDALAAAAILRDFLASQSPSTTHPDHPPTDPAEPPDPPPRRQKNQKSDPH